MRDKAHLILPVVWLILGLATLSVCADESSAQLRWNNGDSLPGKLMGSPSNQIRWSSPMFLDDLFVDTDSLNAIIFPKVEQSFTGEFRITTTTGDTFTADPIDSDETGFVFTNSLFGRFSVKRDAIYSLNRTGSTNLIFNGARLDDWSVASTGPIDDLKYKVYQPDINEQDILGKTILLNTEQPVQTGRLTGGVIDMSIAGLTGIFAMQFEGQIEAPRTGDYEFDLWTEDQAQLFVDGELVVDFLKDRRNPEKPAIGIIRLNEGFHVIRVEVLKQGGASQLLAGITDPDGRNRSLIGMNRDNSIWASGPAGFPRTHRKQAGIFRRFQLPRQLEINLNFAATDSPRFVMALGKDALQDESVKSLRLETWDNELVVVQDKLFEPVLTIDADQRDLRLRLVIDDDAKRLSVFDDQGHLLVQMEGIEPATGDSGIYIRNRGDDLTINQLSVYRQDHVTEPVPVDATRTRVHLLNGQTVYGRLFIEEMSAYIVDSENRRTIIDIPLIERIARPGIALRTDIPAVELSYADGTIVRGQIVSVNADQISLNTEFSETPTNCRLTGATALQFGPTISEYTTPESDHDLFVFNSGRLRGTVSFDHPGVPLSWKPDGVATSLRLSNQSSTTIQRGRQNVNRKLSFDSRQFPSLIYLNNGEEIPCNIISYDENTVRFESPFTDGQRIAAHHIKAIEFQLTRESNPQETRPDWLDELLGTVPKGGDADPVKLERALTNPRFNRNNPPSHILMANNGDMMRGKLLDIEGESLRFESKMRRMTVPVDRLAKVVNVSPPVTDPVPANRHNTEWHGKVRTLLSDGSIFLFRIVASEDGKFTGRSEIYGNISIPIGIIQELSIGGFGQENFLHPFEHWVTKPAKEPDFGLPDEPEQETDRSLPDAGTSRTKGNGKLTTNSNNDRALNTVSGRSHTEPARTSDRMPDLGKVILNPQDRSLRFPIEINQHSGLVEYALVTDEGKTHESLFRTGTEPTHIHLGLLLLGGKPGYTEEMASAAAQILPGDKLQIDIVWTVNGVQHTKRLGAFIVTINNAQSLSRSFWTYNGSVMTNSGITAQRDGSLVSLRLDKQALINNPRPGRMNDELHHVNASALPNENENLEMVMRLISTQPDRSGNKTSTSPATSDTAIKAK